MRNFARYGGRRKLLARDAEIAEGPVKPRPLTWSEGPRPLDVGTSREPSETWSTKGNGLGVSILHERTMVSPDSCSDRGDHCSLAYIVL